MKTPTMIKVLFARRSTSPIRHDPNTDVIGTEIYTSHYHERRIMRFIIGALAAVSMVQCGAILNLSGRKVEHRYVRIDELGRAVPIAYNDLDYTPREGEIRTFLTDWATYRYGMLKESVGRLYPRNYYFIDDALAAKLMARDLNNRTIAKVLTNQLEENEVQVNNVTFTHIGKERIGRASLYAGTAIIDLYKVFANGANPRREHWQVAVNFYLNPDEVSKRARNVPEYETINPLGLIITSIHESRANQ